MPASMLGFFIILSFVLTPELSAKSEHGSKSQERLNLARVAEETLKYYFNENDPAARHLPDKAKSGLSLSQFARSFALAESKNKSDSANMGLFVTLFSDGKTRACWGSLGTHYRNLAEATVYTTIDAIRKDYRQKPISSSEISRLKVQVTVVRSLEPIVSIAGQNPLKDGLLVRSGGRSGILLPGEAKDAHYQLVACKLKAGIKSGQPVQIYRIKADLYR
jgi:AMMECR1 domain-containing protein